MFLVLYLKAGLLIKGTDGLAKKWIALAAEGKTWRVREVQLFLIGQYRWEGGGRQSEGIMDEV